MRNLTRPPSAIGMKKAQRRLQRRILLEHGEFGLCCVEMPSLRKFRLISYTRSNPRTTRRFAGLPLNEFPPGTMGCGPRVGPLVAVGHFCEIVIAKDFWANIGLGKASRDNG
jgi:hypothetical protein